MAKEKELQSIKKLLLSDDETNHLLAIQLMKGLNVSPSDMVDLITIDDFVIMSRWRIAGPRYLIEGYGTHNYSYIFNTKNKLKKLIECQTRSQNYLIRLMINK
tara:strand:- start:612 stop:920 length:309 start_codon:yes stop_codon:yes gene_type:complete